MNCFWYLFLVSEVVLLSSFFPELFPHFFKTIRPSAMLFESGGFRTNFRELAGALKNNKVNYTIDKINKYVYNT
jgi:hypothetical protein